MLLETACNILQDVILPLTVQGASKACKSYNVLINIIAIIFLNKGSFQEEK